LELARTVVLIAYLYILSDLHVLNVTAATALAHPTRCWKERWGL